jgi:hypothetical protein
MQYLTRHRLESKLDSWIVGFSILTTPNIGLMTMVRASAIAFEDMR